LPVAGVAAQDRKDASIVATITAATLTECNVGPGRAISVSVPPAS